MTKRKTKRNLGGGASPTLPMAGGGTVPTTGGEPWGRTTPGAHAAGAHTDAAAGAGAASSAMVVAWARQRCQPLHIVPSVNNQLFRYFHENAKNNSQKLTRGVLTIRWVKTSASSDHYYTALDKHSTLCVHSLLRSRADANVF